MQRITAPGGWTLAANPARTRHFYLTIPSVGTACGCLYCRNFEAAASHGYLPGWVPPLLAELGLDPLKPAEVMEFGPDSGPHGTCLYIAIYHLVGRVLEAPPNASPEDAVSFTIQTDFLPPEFPGPVLQLMLSLYLPRVVAEEEAETIS